MSFWLLISSSDVQGLATQRKEVAGVAFGGRIVLLLW